MLSPTLELTLPRRVHPQPAMRLHRGGDCASCAIGGIVGLPVERIHGMLERLGRTRPAWPMVCRELESEGLVEEFNDDTPIWPLRKWNGIERGLTATMQSMEWWRYLRMAIRAGYYGLAGVHFTGAADQSIDHLVALCGVRHVVDDGLHRYEVLVSCSARHPEGRWVERLEFLRTGGFDLVLIRPRGRPTVGPPESR